MSSVATSLCVTVSLAVGGFAADEGVPEPETLFKQLDTDGDGRLTAGELPEDKRPLFERLVRKGDGDSDGKLSLEEFQAAHKEGDSPNLPLTGGGRPNRGGGDPRQRFEMLDRNKDGKVTRDEVPEQARQFLTPLFERLGKDELTLDDFRRIGPPNSNQQSPRDSRQPTMVRLLDADRNGRVSKAEWEKAGEIFKQLDENRDGELDPRELLGPPNDQVVADRERMERPEAQTRPGAGNPQGRAFFARLDANKDGKLSKTEAPPRIRDRFDRLDANSDGQLSPEELRNGFPGGNPGDRPDGQPNRNEGRARPKRPAAE